MTNGEELKRTRRTDAVWFRVSVVLWSALLLLVGWTVSQSLDANSYANNRKSIDQQLSTLASSVSSLSSTVASITVTQTKHDAELSEEQSEMARMQNQMAETLNRRR